MRLRNVKNKEEKLKKSTIITNAKDFKTKWQELFENDNPIYIEIGMGRGDFIIQNALENPSINYIGIEKYDSVILKAYDKIKEENIINLRLVRLDALDIDEVFLKEISRIYLNFSDPWPKKRHHKRRLTSKIFLDKYEKIFKDKKEIIMKTDNLDLYTYSKDSLQENGYHLDYYSENYPNEESNIQTEYEKKFRSLQIPIKKIIACK